MGIDKRVCPSSCTKNYFVGIERGASSGLYTNDVCLLAIVDEGNDFSCLAIMEDCTGFLSRGSDPVSCLRRVRPALALILAEIRWYRCRIEVTDTILHGTIEHLVHIGDILP